MLAIVPGLAAAHPVLLCSIDDARSQTPRLAQMARFQPAEAIHDLVAGGTLDDALLETIAIPIDVAGGTTPLWRVFHGWLASGEAIIGLAINHTIADGMAVLEVSRTLVKLFTAAKTVAASPLSEGSEALITEPTSPQALHPPIEALVNVAPSSLALVDVMYRELLLPRLPSLIRTWLPSPPVKWAGASTKDAPHPRAKRHRTLAVEPKRVKALLATCRAHGVSLTSLLHAAIAAALRPEVNGLPFESTTNVNARRLFAPDQAAAIPPGTGTYVGVVYRTCPAVVPTGSDALWAEARTHYDMMRRPAAFSDSVKVWGMLAYVPDKPAPNGWDAFFAKKLLGPKSDAFELSNIGSTTFGCPTTRAEAGKDGWILSRAIFSQPPQPTSPVGLFSVLSCETGMEIAVGWEAGVAEVDRVLDRLEDVLATVA